MIDIEKFKDIGEEYMEWTFTKRPTKLWIDTDYGRAVIDTKEHEGTTSSWYLEDEAKLMAEAPRLLAEVKRLRKGIRFALTYTRPTPHTDDPWMECREFIVKYLKSLIAEQEREE